MRDCSLKDVQVGDTLILYWGLNAVGQEVKVKRVLKQHIEIDSFSRGYKFRKSDGHVVGYPTKWNPVYLLKPTIKEQL